MIRVDAHHHVWRLARGDYGWLKPESPIYRDYGIDDIRPLLRLAGISHTMLVQAAPTEAETLFMLEQAHASAGLVRGVVGWVDLTARNAASRVAALAKDKLVRGFRPMIQDLPDPDWMLRDEIKRGLEAMAKAGLVFDALVRPVHLPRVPNFSNRYPGLKIMIDHGGKPDVKSGAFAGWARDMKIVARETAAYCKVSGLVTEASPDWTVDHLRPFVDHLLDVFGPGRLAWGSDWPVVNRAGGFERWWNASEILLKGLSEPDRARVLGTNAIEFYGLEIPE